MGRLRVIAIENLLEMLEKLENNERFKLVEVLAKEEYDKGHVPGAIKSNVEDAE